MKKWLDVIPDWILGENKQNTDIPMVGYTGDGGNGVIEPRKPVEMVQSKQGPVMLHEGEGKMQNHDGSVTVVPQKELQAIEMGTGMKGMADGGTYDPADQIPSVASIPKTGTDYFNQGIEAIGKIASGESPALKSMENRANQGFGGAQIAAQGAAKQGAAQAGYDSQGIEAIGRMTARNMEGERSTMQANIAQTKQSSADTAAGQLASFGMQARQQEQAETAYQDAKKQTDWDRMLLYYDPSTPEGLSQLQSAYTEMFGGTAPDFNVLTEQRNYARTKQQQDVTSGENLLTAQELNNVSTQLGISSAQSQSIINDINSGATKDYIQQRYGITLTDAQYNSLSQSYGQKIQLGTLSINAQAISNAANQLGIDTQKMQNVITAINSGATKSYIQNAFGISLSDAEYNSMKEQYLQKVQLGNLTITSQDLSNVSAQLGIDTAQSQAIIAAINSGATKDYIQQSFGVSLSDSQFSSMQKKYNQSVTAGDYELEQLKTTVGDQKFASIVSRITAGASRSTINSELGTNLTDAEYQEMFEASDTYFKKQGLTMEQATLYGYTDENGQHVKGSAELAQEQFGLQSKTLELQEKELFGYTRADGTRVSGKYDLMSAEDKRAADALYGYSVKDANGNVIGRVSGSLELAEKSYDLQKQGLDLESAQIKGYIDPVTGNFVKGSVQLNAEKQGMEVSSLYGYYYDPKTGQIITDPAKIAQMGNQLEHVDGSLALAGKTFGLQEKTYEDQRLELFGGTDQATGKEIKGKYDLLAAEDQRAADTLYGYNETMPDGTKVHRAGTLEIQADELSIKKQGLTLDEAKLYGYDKNGTHVKGALEIESSKLDMLEDEYDKQQASTQGTALASYFNLMSNTGKTDYNNDPQAKKLLQDYWTAITGDTGPYDHDWAEQQWQASTVTEIDAAIQKMQNSDWYKSITDEKLKNDMMKTVQFAAMLSVTGGVVPEYGTDGEIVSLKDSDGSVIWQLKPEETVVSNSTTGTAANVKIPENKSSGDTFIQNEVKYKVNDDGKTVTQIDYPEWQRSYDAIKEDPRFNEMTAAGTLDANKWKESGAKTMDEYIQYTQTKEKYGDTTTGYSITNGSLVKADGTNVPIADYTTILKNASDPTSPNYQMYQDLLKSASTALNNTGIKSATRNTLSGRPTNGTVVNFQGRLLYVKSQGRFTKGGRDADTITLVDISSGKEETFSGRKSDGNAGKSILNLKNWVTSLGV